MRAQFTASSVESNEYKNTAVAEMVERTFAIIEFDPQGTILQANQNFLDVLSYEMNEIVGQNHSIFIEQNHLQSPEYQQFWQDLRSGKHFTGQVLRVAKTGARVWIQATYAPVFDEHGGVVKIIKLATDISARRFAVEQISEGLEALAAGDLAHRVFMDPKNELFDLAEGFNASMERLAGVFKVVGEVAGGLDQAAREMEQRSGTTAESSLRNAATFEETSAEVDMMTESIKNSAQSAQDATAGTLENARLADVGAASMAQALEATTAMRKATDEMSGINEVIDSIAFQTNLLALNAGIEAARAGQSGAGFAVVATEIRNLAGRSQDASSQIQSLIARSIEQAKTTETHVHESEGNLKQVQGKSRVMADNMGLISNETKEQFSRVAIINQTIRELAISSERDAQLASENEDSAGVLSTFSAQLNRELSQFSTR
ncbi:methyl-accepting chemotaxis protein [Pseudosulfitobacter sp. SM2401]|uniref:methyl-accepting chemotaxis protein n=1 Tax=Pseudosulfitobacter sp. SM2401 TaxID=3350098 RepID=UPI0036F23553